MTAPAVFAVSLALVCSICGIATEHPADHDVIQEISSSKFGINMKSHGTEPISRNDFNQISNIEDDITKTQIKDETYKDNDIQINNVNMYKIKMREFNGDLRYYDKKILEINPRAKRNTGKDKCESFKLESTEIMHPHDKRSLNKNYYSNTTCVYVINTQNNMVIQLTFIDIFNIEYHPQCAYDYLEIRDGLHGYSNLLGKLCGQDFPKQITSTGPNVWMKFRSDSTLEYEGFKIIVEFIDAPSHSIPESCFKVLNGTDYGILSNASIDPDCKSGSANQALDVLWTVRTSENTMIYVNFTEYSLEKPNNCDENVIQVFGSILELDSIYAEYCGSVAKYVVTTENVLHIRYFASKATKANLKFRATYNAFKLQIGNECEPGWFDCEDGTCIDKKLLCDKDEHCRLKTDEDATHCPTKPEDNGEQTDIRVILIIFSLILSGMCSVFLFKCIKKLYKDQKIIKENRRLALEDRLDEVNTSRLTLDSKKLQMVERRPSSERENQINETFKEPMNISKRKQTSIERDIQDTNQDLDEEELWRREADSLLVEAEPIILEDNAKIKKNDLSKKEQSIKSKTKEIDDSKDKKKIRDEAVRLPDTRESNCQTRDSLFQTDPPSSSNGSGSSGKGFSNFGYSGAPIARPSPPTTTNTSEITIKLQTPPKETKTHKKPDRRPISTETTRSAPDVIILSKPTP